MGREGDEKKRWREMDGENERWGRKKERWTERDEDRNR